MEKKQLSVGGAEKMPINTGVNHQTSAMQMMMTVIEKGGDLVQLEKLMDLQERWEKAESRKSFYAGLSAFQSEIPEIKKNGLASFDHRNGGGKTEYSFAKIGDIAKAINPMLSKHGLSYRFEQKLDQSLISVTCVVTHSLGHEERAEMSAFPDQSGKKNQIQQFASTVSYLRRYTLTGALGLVTSDADDDAAGYVDQVQQQTTSQAGGLYPDDKFQRNASAWVQMIQGGQKTADDYLIFAASKGLPLTQQQYDKLKQAEQAK